MWKLLVLIVCLPTLDARIEREQQIEKHPIFLTIKHSVLETGATQTQIGAAETSKRVRVGLARINNKTKSSVSADELRERLINDLNSSGIEAVPLNASSLDEAHVEAKAKQCDYILLTDISTLKDSSGRKILSSILTQTTGVNTGISTKSEARLDFRLFPTGSSSATIESSATGKEDTKEATLAAALGKEAKSVVANIKPATRTQQAATRSVQEPSQAQTPTPAPAAESQPAVSAAPPSQGEDQAASAPELPAESAKDSRPATAATIGKRRVTPPRTAAATAVSPTKPAPQPESRPQPTSPNINATCDDLAAHPEDKGRSGAGIADEKIVPDPAIEKCARAVRQSPNVARFHFQLGRAYWAAKRYDEALDAFLQAEEMAYAPAYFYLGQAYEQGRIAGEQANPATAKNLYMIAASEGFGPAVRVYRGDTATGEIDFSEFKQPALLRGFYEENYDALNKERAKALFYAMGIIDFLEMNPEEFEDPALACRRHIISTTDYKGLAERMARNEPRDGTEGALQSEGKSDAYLLAYDYGACAGAAVGQVYDTVTRFVNPKALDYSRTPLVSSSIRSLQMQGDYIAATEKFGGHGWNVEIIASALRPHKGMIKQQLDDLHHKNQRVLTCFYESPTQVITAYHFWYKSPPANLYELFNSVPEGLWHPLKDLGSNAIEVCPSSIRLAIKAQYAGGIPE